MTLNLLQTVNVLLDRGYVGHLERAAVTAQGASMNVLFFMFSIAMALGTAATAIVSRAYGAKDMDEVHTGAQEALRLSAWLALCLTVLTILISAPVSAMLLPANAVDAQKVMVPYLVVYGLGLPSIYVIQTLAGSLRAVGDTMSPMIISGVQIAIHMVLNVLLIFPQHQIFGGITVPGLGLGLMGAGLALCLSSWVSMIGYLAYVSRTPLGKINLWGMPKMDWAKRLINIAGPAAVMGLLRVGSLTAFTLILRDTKESESAIGAMAVAFAVEAIMFMPGFGLGMAAAALVGQSLGAKNPTRAERVGWLASHWAALITLAVVLPIFLGAHDIAASMLANKPEYVNQATALLHALCYTEIFFSYAMVLTSSLQGAGDTKAPLWITIFGQWVLRVPLAYGLAITLGLGAMGAWAAMSFSQAISGMLAMVAWKQGHWKTKKV